MLRHGDDAGSHRGLLRAGIPGRRRLGDRGDWQLASFDLPGYAAPTMTGGILRHDSRDLLRQYCRTTPEGGFRSWAQIIADLQD